MAPPRLRWADDQRPAAVDPFASVASTLAGAAWAEGSSGALRAVAPEGCVAAGRAKAGWRSGTAGWAPPAWALLSALPPSASAMPRLRFSSMTSAPEEWRSRMPIHAMREMTMTRHTVMVESVSCAGSSVKNATSPISSPSRTAYMVPARGPSLPSPPPPPPPPPPLSSSALCAAPSMSWHVISPSISIISSVTSLPYLTRSSCGMKRSKLAAATSRSRNLMLQPWYRYELCRRPL
mmetsp:Transcript_24004/g.60410  ORF Transcript_24004/g.60410 Transcript_24004/m.60410 type:complete len:236 (+) Transcript_24004:73-780(+)